MLFSGMNEGFQLLGYPQERKIFMNFKFLCLKEKGKEELVERMVALFQRRNELFINTCLFKFFFFFKPQSPEKIQTKLSGLKFC